MQFAATDPRSVNVNDNFVITSDDIGNILDLNNPDGGKYQGLHAILHNASRNVLMVTLLFCSQANGILSPLKGADLIQIGHSVSRFGVTTQSLRSCSSGCWNESAM